MKHRRKLLVFIISVLILAAIGFAYLIYSGRLSRTSTERSKDRYTEEIEQFKSSVDADQDGIDDQTDMLEGALDYIATSPKYKSKYYNTGYPDDGYGVCTDVVARSCLAAGYDLMELVQKDIAANPEDYDIEKPDKNIDFRRVKNLKVYFENHAVSLTTDIHDIEKWQGGDIVVFKKHIGIVSDRRNKNGVPYLIHHNDPWQQEYEEDILEKCNDITGHFRISE